MKKAQLSAKDGAMVIAGAGAEVVCTTLFQSFELTGEYRSATDDAVLTINFNNLGGVLSPGPVTMGDKLVPRAGNGWGTLNARFTSEGNKMSGGGKNPGPRGSGAFQYSASRIGFVLPSKDGARVELRNIKLRPLEAKPLLNGKDLSGWKVFQDPKRSRTKFEVTPAGELHITNGPGDLQTEAKYADFVLQLECKTNGKNLNSGVFFRCVPGQYQNGYEAQIHNGYKNNDRTKPTDFGTGAVYRRVPARKVVANDNEWFTMTVVANGSHVSTWVNGYQTADWTDTRKPADNPRQGLRTAAGHLSIQGHDPTTDILFRNIRIAELK
jgi:hypothetical protein